MTYIVEATVEVVRIVPGLHYFSVWKPHIKLGFPRAVVTLILSLRALAFR